jgi:hypothetical protein
MKHNEILFQRDKILEFNISPGLRNRLVERAVTGYREGQYDFRRLVKLLGMTVPETKQFLQGWERDHGLEPSRRTRNA